MGGRRGGVCVWKAMGSARGRSPPGENGAHPFRYRALHGSKPKDRDRHHGSNGGGEEQPRAARHTQTGGDPDGAGRRQTPDVTLHVLRVPLRAVLILRGRRDYLSKYGTQGMR